MVLNGHTFFSPHNITFPHGTNTHILYYTCTKSPLLEALSTPLHCTHTTVDRMSYWKLLTTPLTPATSDGGSAGGVSCTFYMVAAPHKPRRCLTPFFSFFVFFHLVSPSSMDTLDFNIRLVQRVLRSNWNGTSTNWSATALQFSMSVEHPSRRTLQHNPWSSLQLRGSWSRGNRRIHVDPGLSGESDDSNIHRSAWTSLRTHSRGGPDHGRTRS